MTALPTIQSDIFRSLLTDVDYRQDAISRTITGGRAILTQASEVCVTSFENRDSGLRIVGGDSLGAWFKPTANAIAKLLKLGSPPKKLLRMAVPGGH